ncbi:hypothetical protein [Nitrosomonas eutropha]|uniref:hypothetical protein n=1 Tax=Nitrosomonas eutropha TaxID=916 RepID=UPI000942C9FA|nr:hypothetical protein [Nitrosomonas eutropha]
MIRFQDRHYLPAAGAELSLIKKITSMGPKEQAARLERMKVSVEDTVESADEKQGTPTRPGKNE